MIGGKITKRQKNQDGQEDISTVINPKAMKVFGTPQAEINELQAEMNKMANEMKEEYTHKSDLDFCAELYKDVIREHRKT